MPNWVENELWVDKDCLNKTLTGDNTVDFGILLPMPDYLQITSDGFVNTAIYYYLTDSGKDVAAYTEAIKEEWMSIYISFYSKIFGTSNPVRLAAIMSEYINNRLKNSSEESRNTLYSMGKHYVDNIKRYGMPTWYALFPMCNKLINGCN